MNPSPDCCGHASPTSPGAANCRGGGGLNRRDALKWFGVGAASAWMARWPAMAGPFTAADFERLVPADKKLNPTWLASLTARGERAVYRGDDLKWIGMPIGGLGTGQVYLGGDGRLWHWDIFNRYVLTRADHYAKPIPPASPVEQGFAIRIRSGGRSETRTLDRAGFPGVSFCGEYPIGFVEYRDASFPVTVSLEAFSPFIPLNADESSLPATILQFTVKNTSAEEIEVDLAGWMENAVCRHSGAAWQVARQSRPVRRNGLLALDYRATAAPAGTERPSLVFADFEGDTYGDWQVEGAAFGRGPARGANTPKQKVAAHQGRGLVNSFLKSDAPTGRLISPVFTIERQFVCFRIGGGNHPGETCINLVVDGQTARTSTGRNSDTLEWEHWDVVDLAGRKARIEIVDHHAGGWGHICIDQIEFRDRPHDIAARLEDEGDFGSMGLALLDATDADAAMAALPAGVAADDVFRAEPGDAAMSGKQNEKQVGALRRRMVLRPGQSQAAAFGIAWHFPNDSIRMRGKSLESSTRRRYATRFDSATTVLEHLAKNLVSLGGQTRRWHQTWYDSTLPYWFLDRTMLNTSILATSTCHWFDDNRFYGWEGVGCCAGTCTHVWQYAQAAARLFPPLERSLREMTDYGYGFDADTGRIRFRAEHNDHWAVDGQAGVILRTLREHQISADAGFLHRVWPRTRKALEFLIQHDEHADGIIDGPQHNTLDADWHGEVAWLSGLYVAALRAGEEMAREVGDTSFAAQCHELSERGGRAIAKRLFNGEYFIQRADPAFKNTIGSYDGCEIDQVFGQSWAWQVGLGRILDEAKVRTALQSLWRYNFTPDVGPYRAAHPRGRWYAMPGEAGLLMGTWPKGEAQRVSTGFDSYFNECMNGFEYQVAGHMLWEGMLTEGLAITRGVHDRYHPARRNPWNEVECGDHYARSMASYGVFLAACGFEYHGPKGHIGFAPRLSPENFRAAFTAAEGWGTFSQTIDADRQRAEIVLNWGTLRLESLSLAVPVGRRVTEFRGEFGDGRAVGAGFTQSGERVMIRFRGPITLTPDERLSITLS